MLCIHLNFLHEVSIKISSHLNPFFLCVLHVPRIALLLQLEGFYLSFSTIKFLVVLSSFLFKVSNCLFIRIKLFLKNLICLLCLCNLCLELIVLCFRKLFYFFYGFVIYLYLWFLLQMTSSQFFL